MPCYNGMPFVEDAFRGLLEQDYENMEIVLSDDCSSDESLEVAEKMASDLAGRIESAFFATRNSWDG